MASKKKKQRRLGRDTYAVMAESSFHAMRTAFYDLWLDTEERPRIPASHKQVIRLILWHRGPTAVGQFKAMQNQIDAGLRHKDPEVGIEDIIIPAQAQLRDQYEFLFEKMFGVKPRKGE